MPESYSDNNVFVAISGGVDSSVAAALLKSQGYNCRGVYMITHDSDIEARQNAAVVCEAIGVELDVLDLRDSFSQVIEYFCSRYEKGLTPNPCVYCNRVMKFGLLWEHARQNGAARIATGHYARVLIQDGRHCIYEGTESRRDQSYVLSMIKPEMQEKILLPIGQYTKQQVRDLAEKFSLPTAAAPDSQEICFIPDNDYACFLESRIDTASLAGDVIDEQGKVLGTHDGIHRFTVGQRRGLGIAMLKPVYVTNIDPHKKTVTLGPKESLYAKKLIAHDFNWLSVPTAPTVKAKVKIRYNNPGKTAEVKPIAEGKVEVLFDELVMAVTPGQAAVCYVRDQQGWRMLGGGWIERQSE